MKGDSEGRDFQLPVALQEPTEGRRLSFGWHFSDRGELTLVMLGPLTNLAIALNVEPGLADLLRAVVVMAGAYRVPGNTTPAAEFNVLVDPEAAQQVFAAPFRDLIAVGLDVTEQVALTRDDWDAVNAGSALPATSGPAAEKSEGSHSPHSRGIGFRFTIHCQSRSRSTRV